MGQEREIMSLFYDLKKSGEWGEFNDEERNAITGEMKDIVGILQTREEVPAPPPPPEDLTGGPITMVSRTEMQPADIYNPPSAETPAGKVFRAGGAYLGGVLGTLVPFPGSTIAGAITGERVARALTPDFGPRLYEPNVQDMGTREGMASQIGAAVETAAPAIADLALMVASPNAMVGKIISEANQRVQDRQAQGQGSLESYGRTALEEAPMAAATLAGPLAKGFAYAGYPVLAGLSRVLPPAFMAAMAGKNVYEVDAAIKEQFPAMPDDERHSLVAQTASGDIANMAYFTGELGGLGPEIRSYRDIARDPLTGTGGNNVGIYKTPELPPFPLPPFPKTPLPAFPLPKFPREPLPAFPRPPLPEFPIPESLKAAVEEVTKPSTTDRIIKEESNAISQGEVQKSNEEELRGTGVGQDLQANEGQVGNQGGEPTASGNRVENDGEKPQEIISIENAQTEAELRKAEGTAILATNDPVEKQMVRTAVQERWKQLKGEPTNAEVQTQNGNAPEESPQEIRQEEIKPIPETLAKITSDEGFTSTAHAQRTLGINQASAEKLMGELEANGRVSAPNVNGRRTVIPVSEVPPVQIQTGEHHRSFSMSPLTLENLSSDAVNTDSDSDSMFGPGLYVDTDKTWANTRGISYHFSQPVEFTTNKPLKVTPDTLNRYADLVKQAVSKDGIFSGSTFQKVLRDNGFDALEISGFGLDGSPEFLRAAERLSGKLPGVNILTDNLVQNQTVLFDPKTQIKNIGAAVPTEFGAKVLAENKMLRAMRAPEWGGLESDVSTITLPNKQSVTLYKNPTPADIQTMSEQFVDQYPNEKVGTPATRTIEDADGNTYAWMSGEAVHADVSKYLKTTRGIETEPLPSTHGPRELPAPVSAEKMSLRKGVIGDKMSTGEAVLTSSGRETTPFPKVSLDTNRKAANTLRNVDHWLMDNAIEEAKARGDKFNLLQFTSNRDKPSQADKDSAEQYLFGDNQPEVLAPFLKPLVESPVPKEAPGTQRMEMTYTDPGGNEVTVSEEPVMVDNLTQKEIDVLRSNMKAASRTGSTDAYTINDILIGKRPVYRWSGNRGGGEVNSYLKLDSEPDAFYRFSKNQNLTVKTINPAAQAEIDRLSADEAALKDAEQKTAEAEKRANEILRARQEQFQDAVKNTPLPTGKKVTVSVPGELNGKPVQIPLSGTQYGDFLITSEPVKNGSTKKNHSVTHVPTGASLVRNLSSIETAKNIVKSWLLSGADTKFTDLKSPEANEAIKRARGAIAATVDVSKEPPAWFGTEEAPPEPSDTDLVNSLSKKQLAQLALKIKSPQMKGKSKTAENLLANVSPDAISEALQKLNLKVGKKGGIYNPIEFIIELGRKAPEAKRWIENKLGDAWDHALDYAQRGKNYTEWAWTALKKYGDPIKEHLRLLWGDAIDFVTRIKAHLSDRNTAGIFPVAPKPVGPNDLEWTRLTPTQKFWMGLQDGMLSVKKIQNSTLDRGGKLSEFMNSYDKELLRPAYTEAALKEKQDVRIRPFLGAIVEGKLTLEQVEQFTKARGTEEANDYLFDKYGVKDGTGMSTPVAKAIMNFYKKAGILPQLEKVGVLYDRMMLSDLETRLHAGLITPELFVELKTRLKHYFPTKGTPYDIELQMDPSIERSATGQGVDLTKTEYQGRKGRSSDVTNVIGHSIEALENGVVRAGKNPVLQAFYEFCKENPLPDVYEIDPVKVESWQTVIHPKFNGIERTVLIKDPMLAESFKRLSPARQGTVMAAFARFNRWQSQVNTSANPFFIAGNAPKDLLGAGITTAIRLGPKALGRYVLNLPGSFKDQVNWIFRGIDSPDRQRFVSSGAPTGFFSNMDAESNALRMNDEFRSMAATPTTDPTFWAKNCGSALLKFTQNLNQVAELGVRAATFKTGIESGLTDTKAAIFSKEASDNFNAKGLWGPTLAALYVFSNASIQGNASMLATIAMNPVGATAVIGGLLAFGATLDTWNASVSEKDPDHPNYYDLESENAKNLNQFILLPGFKPIQIPLPHNWGFFVSAGRITSAISRGALPPGKGMASLGSIFINTMNPTGGFDTAHPVKMAFPSAVRPTIDVLTNTGWHGGPIHGEAFKKTTPQSELYPRTTNEWLVKLTRSLNEIGGGSRYESSGAPDISPADLQYLFSQTFGGLGQEVMRSATLLRKIVTGEEILEREIPGVRRFYPGWNPTVQGSKFFENASVIESYKDARMNDAAKPEDEWKAALIDQADGIIKMMSARKKELNAAKDAGDTGAVKTIYAEIEVAQQNFNSRFKELSK